MIFLKLIILMICACFSPCYTWRSNNEESHCPEYKSCETCAVDEYCQWSLKQQNCVGVSQPSDSLTVNNKSSCPHYSVVNDSVFLVQQNYTYAVTVSNDVHGFMAFLSGGGPIECYYVEVMLNQTVRFGGRVRGDAIVCDQIDLQRIATMRVFRRKPLYVFQCVVTFGRGTALLLDRPSAGFFGVYTFSAGGRALGADDERCAGANRDADCVKCAWHDGEHVDFVMRCLATNPCVGQFGVYTRVYAGNHTTAETPETAAPVCPDVFAVHDVRPTRAPWKGPADVTIAVKNHRVMEAGARLLVTVAGRACAPVRPAGPDAIRCTVDGPAAAAANGSDRLPWRGPVVVRYALTRVYVLTSQVWFEWTYPQVTAVRLKCDARAAAPVLTIDGALFESGAVRVTAGDRTCETVYLADDRIVCRPVGSDTPARGLVKLTFDGGSWTTRVIYNQSHQEAGGPAADPGQLFEGIASGGTSVRLRGTGLACAERPRAYAEPGDRAEAECRVHNDTLMVCRSPRTDAPGPVSLVFVASFAGETRELGRARYAPRPDPRFAGFETVGGAVVLYGSGLDAGYRADDVRVRSLRSDEDGDGDGDGDDDGDVCAVTEVTHDRIVCEPAVEGAAIGLSHVVVAVGDNYAVTLRNTGIAEEYAVAGPPSRSLTVINSVGTAIAISAVMLSLYFAYLCVKKKGSYRTSPEPLVDIKNETYINTADIKS